MEGSLELLVCPAGTKTRRRMSDEGQVEAATTSIPGCWSMASALSFALGRQEMHTAWGKKINPVSVSVFRIIMKPKEAFFGGITGANPQGSAKEPFL